ncbi:MAG: hypothetical protein NTY38_25755 [Acidobacteria bacterium]|nr:hypothetical protein [Acidobacteriota bacterium]
MRLPVVLLLAVGAFAAAPVPPAVRAHPRVHIDAALLAQIRALRDARDPLWTRIESYIRPMPYRPETGSA